jgi:hypothetical protein
MAPLIDTPPPAPSTSTHTHTHTHTHARNQVAAQIAAGDNVVLLANHQTEADPGVFAHMLAASHPNLATDVIYVAGDRCVLLRCCRLPARGWRCCSTQCPALARTHSSHARTSSTRVSCIAHAHAHARITRTRITHAYRAHTRHVRRVVTDPLCKPFSMGRNLFCVHSKKHLDDVPELKASKMETNRKTLVAMQRAFNTGGLAGACAGGGGGRAALWLCCAVLCCGRAVLWLCAGQQQRAQAVCWPAAHGRRCSHHPHRHAPQAARWCGLRPAAAATAPTRPRASGARTRLTPLPWS